MGLPQSVVDKFEEFTSKMSPRGGVRQEPRVGYGTFCGSDPTTPNTVNSDAGSSGEFSWVCPDANGATGTPEGTDYDPSWPIEHPYGPQHDHDHDDHDHDHDDDSHTHPDPTDPVNPDSKTCCDCTLDLNTCDPIDCCLA